MTRRYVSISAHYFHIQTHQNLKPQIHFTSNYQISRGKVVTESIDVILFHFSQWAILLAQLNFAMTRIIMTERNCDQRRKKPERSTANKCRFICSRQMSSFYLHSMYRYTHRHFQVRHGNVYRGGRVNYFVRTSDT